MKHTKLMFGASIALASSLALAQAGTTLRVPCFDVSDGRSAGHTDIFAVGQTCAQARQTALQEANSRDVCRYQRDRTDMSKRAGEPRQFLQTNTCPGGG